MMNKICSYDFLMWMRCVSAFDCNEDEQQNNWGCSECLRLCK